MLKRVVLGITIMVFAAGFLLAQDEPVPVSKYNRATGGIQWFATLESGLKAAEETGRPILFLSAAPHCGGVSGVW